MKQSVRILSNLQDSVSTIVKMCLQNQPFKTDMVKGANDFYKCKALWYFVKNNIKYRQDSFFTDQIRTPERTWKDRKQGVDCEDYVIFICAILRQYNIKPILRITGYLPKKEYQHIYVVVIWEGREVIMDCCMDDFNAEMPYKHKIDIDLSKPNLSVVPKQGKYFMQVLSGMPKMTPEDVLRYEGKKAGQKPIEELTNEDTGILSQYFTPQSIIDEMYKLCVHYGFTGGNALEPSCGSGRFMHYAPRDHSINWTAFEQDKELADMAKILVPDATIYPDYFESAFLQKTGAFYNAYKGAKDGTKTWLPEMDLVIGNPPYVKWKNKYTGLFTMKGITQTEQFFMLQGLRVLKKGGLLCYVTSNSFADTFQKYKGTKEQMGEMCELVDAYRLPKVFYKTDVTTDILIFRKK